HQSPLTWLVMAQLPRWKPRPLPSSITPPLLLATKTVPTPITTPLTSPLAHLPLLTLRVTPEAEANPATTQATLPVTTPLVEEPRMRSSRLRTSKALVPPPLSTARP